MKNKKCTIHRVYTLMDGLGNSLDFVLSSSSDHVLLLSQLDFVGSNIFGDKAYGAKAIREYIDSQDVAYRSCPSAMSAIHGRPIGIPTRNGISLRASFRNSRVFTHYDKLDASFLAFIHVTACCISVLWKIQCPVYQERHSVWEIAVSVQGLRKYIYL